MKNKLFYLSLAISIIALIINIIAYPHLPDRVPVHWGINGEVNRYGSKLELFVLGALPFVILFIRQIIPKVDPKRESYRLHPQAYSVMTFVTVVILVLVNLVAIAVALGYKVAILKVFPPLIGITMIVMGNYMAQLRPNYFIGIRNPWTLASETVWRKTHRFGGFVTVITGIVSLLAVFLGVNGLKLSLLVILLGVVVIYGYSFLIYKKSN